mgnify:FL=1
MEISERIKVLRKDILKLTQQDFSEALNMSRSNMGNIEIGRIAVTDRVISDICEKFNVNEEWLRNGTGNIFVELTKDQELATFVAQVYKEDENSFKRRLLSVLSSLSEDEWGVLANIAEKIAKEKD